MHLHPLFVLAFELISLIGGGIFVYSLFKRTLVDGNCQIASHSGDAETMTFNLNLPSNLSADEKQDRISEAFSLIQERRTENFEKMEEIRKQAIEENKQRAAGGPDARLQAVPPEGQ